MPARLEPPSSWQTILAAGLIVAVGAAAYYNSFVGTFAYDDEMAILENPTIRQLWPIAPALSPPPNGETVTGRPLLNLSLAVNYAISGLKVWSYHAVNLAIHIAAALLLFGILRRTLLVPMLRDRFGRAATALALASALLWIVHPLQTESVTYIVQRAESLAGLFYLLTLYCVIRGVGARGEGQGTRSEGRGDTSCSPLDPRPSSLIPLWHIAAVLACLLGMACKEIMATAPLIVLLYDRTFLAGSFAAALRQRWRLYVGLAATWGLLAYLVFSTGLIARQAELGAPDPLSYARSQPGVILHYLRLCLWPDHLCISYDWPVANTLGEILPGAMVVGILLAATVWGLLRRNAWGFLGAWFFLILAPTSSILPLYQLAHEHRMYLSLAAVVVIAVAGGYVLWDKLAPRLSPFRLEPGGQSPFSPGTSLEIAGLPAAKKGTVPAAKKGTVPAATKAEVPSLTTAVRWAAPLVILAGMLVGLGYATVTRNWVYQSLLTIWQDAVEKRPTNPFAHYNLATVLDSSGRTSEAIEQYQVALRLKPDHLKARLNLGTVLAFAGRTDEAIAQYQAALRLKPDCAEAHNDLGLVLVRAGRLDEAIKHYHHALRLRPGYFQAHNNLANALARLSRTSEAIEQYQEALRLKPDFAEAHNNLGSALASTGRTHEAIEHYQQALRLKTDYLEAHHNLADALVKAGGISDAIEHYQQVVRLKADFMEARYSLARALASAGRTSEAIEQYEQLLQRLPNFAAAMNDLAWLLATCDPAEGGDPARAVQWAQRARELAGRENAQYLDTLAAAYAAAGRFSDAMISAQRAAELAESAGQGPLAKAIRARLELYRAGQPYRVAPRP